MLQDARVKQKTLAVPWQKQLIADEPDTHIGRDHAMSDRLALAALYGEIGDKADEHRTLRDLIARYDAQPDHGSTAGAQAEYALKTGQYPWDSNYAGPTH
jgi:hypothetical protein